MSLTLLAKNPQQKIFSMVQKPLWCAAWSILAGLCIAFTLPPYAIPGLIWIAFLPFLSLLYFPITNGKRLFFYGWVAGVAATWPTFNWVFEGAPYTWFNLKSYAVSSLLGVFGLGLPTILFALAFGAFLVVGRKLLRHDYWDILTLGLLWGVMEYLRVLAYSFYPFQLGSGAIVGDHMAFAITAYAFSELENIRQLISILGPYGLGALAMTSNAGIFYCVRRLLRPQKIALLREILIFSFIGLFLSAALLGAGQFLKTQFIVPSGAIKVALVQLTAQTEDVWQPGYFSRTRELMIKLIRSLVDRGEDFDIVFLPENAGIFNSRRGIPQLSGEEVRKVVGGDDYRIMVEGTFPDGLAKQAHLAIFDTASGLTSTYAKRFLMPYGEYMPYFLKFPLLFFGKDRFIDALNEMEPGEESAVHHTKIGNIATLICSEVLSPQLIRNSVRDGGKIILLSASISVLRGSPKYHKEVIAAAKTWATMTRRYLVYVGNAEPVFVVDELGNLQWENSDMTPGITVRETRLNSARTPAVKHPFFFLASSGIYLGVMIAKKRFRKK